MNDANGLHEIRLEFENYNLNSFPNEFKLKVDEKSIDVNFVKLNKSEHPISSSDIYLIDEQTKQPKLFDSNYVVISYHIIFFSNFL